jgi:2-keto-4-pentenoate hydratase/2-oxohepta-3-ene-1,7-dioic acid hydratase in catechol pathway
VRWSTYISGRDGADHVALVSDDTLYGLASPGRLIDLLGDDGTRLAEAAASARADPWEVVGVGEARLRAPIPVPPSMRDFMAFEEHVVTSSRALGQDVDPVWYEMPLFYFTNPAAVLGPSDDVPVAPGSVAWDYELEVAAVIGRPGRNLHPDRAEDHIAGYVIFCDWSARDLQGAEMRGNLGPAKGKDSATSLGPWLVTPDELAARRAGNAYNLEMTASVNGARWSGGNMASIYWSFGQLLAYASRGTELRTGDIIGSGTVGTGCILELSRVHGREAYPWLTPGDRVRLEVTLLGAIDATVTPAAPVVALR